jgi:hypothetical protein
MAAPDSSLRLALGGYAPTFVRWHLWAMVLRGLAPEGRLTRTLTRGSAQAYDFTYAQLFAVFCDCTAVSRVRPLMAPCGRLIGEGFEPGSMSDGSSVASGEFAVADGSDEWAVYYLDRGAPSGPALGDSDEGGASRPRPDELINTLGPSVDVADELLGIAVAWDSGAVFVAYVCDDEDWWVAAGPPCRTAATRPPMHHHRLAGRDLIPAPLLDAPLPFGCDRQGRRLHMLVRAAPDSGSESDSEAPGGPDTPARVVTFATCPPGAGTWRQTHAWTADSAVDMAVTDTGLLALSHATKENMLGWIGVYTPNGTLVTRWELPSGPTAVWGKRWLQSDPRSGELVLMAESFPEFLRGEWGHGGVQAYVYA